MSIPSPRLQAIQEFVNDYRNRINASYDPPANVGQLPSFAEKLISLEDVDWVQENYERFLFDSPNDTVVEASFLSEMGYITAVVYSPDGSHIVTAHSTGLVQYNKMDRKTILKDFSKTIYSQYTNERRPVAIWYPLFSKEQNKPDDTKWVQANYEKFIKYTNNKNLYNRMFLSEWGAITAIEYAPNGSHVVVGHASGLIQVRNGSNGSILSTLRCIQFPPKPIYGLEYSKLEERVCYATCTDGIVYRLEIPSLALESILSSKHHLLVAESGLESLNVQFFGTPGLSTNATPFITGRALPLSLSISAENARMAVGYSDSSIRIYDMATQQVISTYKVHKLRLNFTPKKLQRMHTGQVSALCCHPTRPTVMASGSWDETLRIWDSRCRIGCIMTFEGVNIIGNSVDLNRDLCIAGSWQPIEALTTWDLVAKKKICDVKAQNRRPDVDGEFIYACKFWRSSEYNRKGKYAIIGGSGTRCLEVINLHNRYIACSYPTMGSILALASHEEKIAYGGTASMFCVASFHDPKHEDVYDRGDNMENVAKWAQSTLDEAPVSDISSLMPQGSEAVDQEQVEIKELPSSLP